METLLQDIRFGARMLLKSPGFTAIIVIVLAVGIGANSAIFSVVNAVVFRPLPFRDPESLVMIQETRQQRGNSVASVSLLDFYDWRDQSASFDGMAAFSAGIVNRTDGPVPERVESAFVSPNIFDVVGVSTAQGRLFLPEEAEYGRHRVAVLTDAYWRAHFGADPNTVGRAIMLDGESFEVIGVLPQEARFPILETEPDVWVPLSFDAQETEDLGRGAHFLNVVARLRAGTGFEQAQAELTTIAEQLERTYPDSNTGHGAALSRIHEHVVGDVRPALFVLFGAVGFVLLIACSNVANLLLARATARQKEVAVRMSLGAGRARLVRQFLTESVIVSIVAAVVGVLAAFWGLDLLVAIGPEGLPRVAEIGLDGEVLGYTVAISVLTGIAFGIAPALYASRLNLVESLKDGGTTSSAGPGRQRMRSLFVVAQVAMALVLLAGAGLSLRSLSSLLDVDLGFDAQNLTTMSISLPDYKYSENEQLTAFHRTLAGELESIPGVESATTITPLPFGGSNIRLGFNVVGRPENPGEGNVSAYWRSVGPDYFETMRIPVLRGRALGPEETETSKKVIVINETMARTHFPDEDPIGKQVEIGYDDYVCEVVGIVGDVKFNDLSAENTSEFYSSYQQTPWQWTSIVVRSSLDADSVAAAVRDRVQAIDPDLPVYDLRTMGERLSASLAEERFQATLLAVFALVALLLATIGLYAAMSYWVSQRTHEIGIHMALGAGQGDVMRLVLGQSLVLTGVGVVVGLGAAVALTRTMSGLLYGVSATDPAAFGAVTLLLVAVALLASYLPARRASRVDPKIALRYE